MQVLNGSSLHPGLRPFRLIDTIVSYHGSTPEKESFLHCGLNKGPTCLAALLTSWYLSGTSQLPAPATVASEGRRSLRGAPRVIVARIGGFALVAQLSTIIHGQALVENRSWRKVWALALESYA